MSEELVSRADEGVSGCQRLRTRARRRRSQHHHVAAAVAELRPAAVSRRADACATRRPSRRASCQESGSVAPEVLRTCATRVAACNRHEHDSCARLWHEQCARRGFLQRSLREWPQDASRSATSGEYGRCGRTVCILAFGVELEVCVAALPRLRWTWDLSLIRVLCVAEKKRS